MMITAARFGAALSLCLAFANGAANAASIGLSSNYSVDFKLNVDAYFREGGAITYDWDTNSLIMIGDEGDTAGYSITTGTFNYDLGSLPGFRDPEGVTYLGDSTYGMAQERTLELNKVIYGPEEPGWTPSWHPRERDTPTFCIDGCNGVGNTGLEGISYDRHTGDFYAVKETGDQKVWRLSGVDFADNGIVEELFDPALLGLTTLSDISVLSNSDLFQGTPFGDNLLILSASSRKLLEVTKTGEILSMFDLSDLGVGGIEGVTVDNEGNIWLLGEQARVNSFGQWESGLIKLRRNVAAPAVPEPATWAMMIGGFALVGASMRRRKTAVRFA